MIIKTKNIIPFVLIFLFVMPPSIVAFIPLEMRDIYYYIIIMLYWILFLLFFKPIFLKKDNSFLTGFTLLVTFSGLLTFIIKDDISLFNIIFPIAAFSAYKICIYEKVEFKRLFNLYFLFLYILCYINYYSIIPDFFYRPEFDEDMLMGASSNAIPMALNNSLLTYMTLNFLYKWRANKSILTISIINLLLNIIQQGRGGIIIGLIILSIAIYEYSPKLLYRFRYLYVAIFSFIVFTSVKNVIEYIDLISFTDYSILNETRIIAQLSFFDQLSISNFFFGFSENIWFDDEPYTYNMFLDFWNKYNFLTLSILLFIFIHRIYKNKSFLFPIYYLIPVLIYAMIESIYLPSFRDFFIYLILFLPNNYKI